MPIYSQDLALIVESVEQQWATFRPDGTVYPTSVDDTEPTLGRWSYPPTPGVEDLPAHTVRITVSDIPGLYDYTSVFTVDGWSWQTPRLAFAERFTPVGAPGVVFPDQAPAREAFDVDGQLVAGAWTSETAASHTAPLLEPTETDWAALQDWLDDPEREPGDTTTITYSADTGLSYGFGRYARPYRWRLDAPAFPFDFPTILTGEDFDSTKLGGPVGGLTVDDVERFEYPFFTIDGGVLDDLFTDAALVEDVESPFTEANYTYRVRPAAPSTAGSGSTLALTSTVSSPALTVAGWVRQLLTTTRPLVAPLRQAQRDDRNRQRTGRSPTSRQRSLRQGSPNTYL